MTFQVKSIGIGDTRPVFTSYGMDTEEPGIAHL